MNGPKDQTLTEAALQQALRRSTAALARLSQATSREEYDRLQIQRIQADRDYYNALARHFAATWGKGGDA